MQLNLRLSESMRRRKKQIGIVLDLALSLTAQLIDGVAYQVRGGGLNWDIRIFQIGHFMDNRAVLPDLDGVIVSAPGGRFLKQDGCPLVMIRSETPYAGVPHDSLVLDNRSASGLLVGHLARRGFKRLGMISYPSTRPRTDWVAMRESAFSGECSRLGLAGSIFRGTRALQSDRHRQFNAMARWVDEIGLPCGVVAIDDFRALDLMECCHMRGLRIPGDVAIAGIGNTPHVCAHTVPPLTSLGLNHQEFGRRAAAMLEALMRHPEKAGRVVMFGEFRLHERASTDTEWIGDEVVAAAVSLIRRRCHDPGFGCADVVAQSGISHTALNRRFCKALHGGVLDCLIGERLRLAKELLADPSIPLKLIAEKCGFRTPQYFSTVFRRHEKMTPNTYRRRRLDEQGGIMTNAM